MSEPTGVLSSESLKWCSVLVSRESLMIIAPNYCSFSVTTGCATPHMRGWGLVGRTYPPQHFCFWGATVLEFKCMPIVFCLTYSSLPHRVSVPFPFHPILISLRIFFSWWHSPLKRSVLVQIHGLDYFIWPLINKWLSKLTLPQR